MEISDFARTAAQLLGLRIINDPREPGTLALIRDTHDASPSFLVRRRGMLAVQRPGVMAYVHCEILRGPDFTDADWIELFTQLWPGIEKDPLAVSDLTK